MLLKKKISKVLIANLLGLAFLFPFAIQFMHSIHAHEHSVCSDSSTHLHEEKFECSIFDFHFSTFTFTPLDAPKFDTFVINHHLDNLYTFIELSASLPHYNLRGPPLLS